MLGIKRAETEIQSEEANRLKQLEKNLRNDRDSGTKVTAEKVQHEGSTSSQPHTTAHLHPFRGEAEVASNSRRGMRAKNQRSWRFILAESESLLLRIPRE